MSVPDEVTILNFFTSSDILIKHRAVRVFASSLSMKIWLMPSADKHTHTLTHTSPHVLHIFASEPLEHPGGTEEAKQGIRSRRIAADLCVFAMAERAECGCALTERKKNTCTDGFSGLGGRL